MELFLCQAVRASGWLSSPGTTHHVDDHGTEAWLTVITRLDDASDVRDDLTSFLKAPPTLETIHGALAATPVGEALRPPSRR